MMKIKLSNFGPISEFVIDLDKGLHLIVGGNNVGKSYAITVIYIILKNLIKQKDFFEMSTWGVQYFKYTRGVENVDSKIIKLGSSLKYKESVNINNIISDDIRGMLESYTKSINNSLLNTFGSISNLSNKLSNGNLKIKLEFKSITIDYIQKDNQLVIGKIFIHKTHELKRIKQNREPHYGDLVNTIYYCKEHEKDISATYIMYLYRFMNRMMIDVKFHVKSIDYLPASRSGLYQALSAFGQIFAELSKSRSFLTEKIEIPGISEPLSDYFLKLSSIDISRKISDESESKKIALEIEKEILQGEVEIDKETKKIIYRPYHTDLRLDLSATSSMVSEISPIVSYLKYVIEDSDSASSDMSLRKNTSRRKRLSASNRLIIIEEPEAHLHPEIQIKLTEIFSKLIKCGFKLIITSHSNFIFNKINNLIIDKKISLTDVSATVFGWSDKGGVARNLDIDEFGIVDENFVSSTESLFKEKLGLLDNYNKK